MSSRYPNDEEGPNAILNKKDRRMLWGEEVDLTDQARWKRYSRIRERLYWGIYDFALLYDNWDELNLDKAFKENIDARMMDGAKGAFLTLYRGLYDTQLSFEKLLIDGIWGAESDMNNRNVDIRFDVDPKAPGVAIVSDAAERVNPDQVNGLRIPEMRAVLESLAYSDADIPKLVKEGNANKPSPNEE